MRLFVILFSISFLLSGCAKKHYAYSGKEEIEASSSASGQSLDSIVVGKHESSSSSEATQNKIEITFTTVEYSKPDSSGNQYKIKETVGSVKQESSKTKDTISNSDSEETSISKSDSSSFNSVKKKNEASETSKKEPYSIPIAFKIIAILFLAGAIYIIWKKLKDM